MGLEKYFEKAAAKTKASFSGNTDKWADYLTKYELKDYFKDVPEEKREELRKTLEAKVDGAKEKFNSELKGITRKTVSKGSMLAYILNDIAAYTTPVGLLGNSALMFPLYTVKTLSEIPALYRYVKKSGDWYGALKHAIAKPLRSIIPVLGAALESGSFDRMVRKRVMKEAKYDFIKEIGEYVPMTEKIKEKLKQPIVSVISDTPKPADYFTQIQKAA